MTHLYKALAGLALLLGVAHAVPAQATADFTLSKSVSTGTFTLTNNSNDLFVDELVVAGTGATAGTTLPGWSATAFFFTDPLNCLGGTGFNVGSGFCYKLTDSTVGVPIGQGSETFTYESRRSTISRCRRTSLCCSPMMRVPILPVPARPAGAATCRCRSRLRWACSWSGCWAWRWRRVGGSARWWRRKNCPDTSTRTTSHTNPRGRRL